MDKSITRQAMTETSKELSRRLRPHGFKRQGVHLHRRSGEFYHALNFQASQWGSVDAGQFTINLVVSSPLLYEEWFERDFPSNPASALFPIQMRIGSLMPEHNDIWWKVTPETDVKSLAAEVSGIAEGVSLKFFALYEDNEALLEQLRKGVCPGCTAPVAAVVHALVAHSLGLEEESRQALIIASSGSEISAFNKRVLSLATRLGFASLRNAP